jgi:hypothetical protein
LSDFIGGDEATEARGLREGEKEGRGGRKRERKMR